MKLNIKYFGLLAEVTRCHEETIDFSKTSVLELLDDLFEKYPDLNKTDFQVAQNQQIVNKNSTISDNEIALLPPFSGG